MDLNNLMQMAGQLKERLDDAQTQADKLAVKGEAGGGMVQVTMNGRHEVVALKIDPSVIKADEADLLEDLVRAAVNHAGSQVGSGIKDRLGGLAKDFGVDMAAFEGMGFPK